MPIISTRPLLLASGAIAAVALVAGAAVPANADPVALSLSASSAVVTLPIGDGYRDTESLSVFASDAASAVLTVQRAGGEASTRDLTLVAGANTVAVPTAGLVAGAYTATVATADGTSNPVTFTVEALHATLTGLTVQRSLSTVYPVKDGYRDSVVLTVRPTVAGPASAKVTGSAKLTRAGRTAKRWSLRSGVNRLTWNGRVGGAVKPGRYTLTVTAKGPQGAARTVRTAVVVSAKRLVTRTAVVAQQASKALTGYKAYDAAAAGVCGQVGAYVVCRSEVAAEGNPYAIIVGGTVKVPAAVRSASGLGTPELRISMRATKLDGSGIWAYGTTGGHTTRGLALGTSTGKAVRLTGNPSTVSLYAALDDSSALTVDRFTFTYRYRALV